MDNEKKQVDSNEDFIVFNRKEERIASVTYQWNFYNEEQNAFFEYSDDELYEKDAIFEGEEKVECIEIGLYKLPEKPPWDLEIRNANWQKSLRNDFFEDIFEKDTFMSGYQPSKEYSVLVMPKKIYDEIIRVFEKFNLLEIKDLLLELIAVGQYFYTADVFFWEQPENQKLITSAEKETAKLIQIIEQSIKNSKYRRKPKGTLTPSLNYINFGFNTGTIKLEHPDLIKEFVENMKNSYSKSPSKDWKKNLSLFPKQFEKNASKSKFKYHLAHSYYNLLVQSNFIDIIDKHPYPNKLMLCITKLFEFSLISVGDIDEADDIKIKTVRNWIKRNSF